MERRVACKTIYIGPTRLRCDSFDDLFAFPDLFSLGFFSLGGLDITFFKDLEAETIYVCIAWALLKYLGLSSYVCFAAFVDLFWFLFSVYWIGDG